MANFNKVILLGNLTRDPALSYLPSQTPVVELGLAVNRTWKGQDGEKHEETCFVDCKSFGKQAEVLNQYLSKGSPILIEGRLNFSSWEGKDGQKRSKLRVIVESFQFMGEKGNSSEKPDSSEQPAPDMGGSQEPHNPNAAYEAAQQQGGDNLPF